LSRPRN
jgi:hypothetical protein